MKAEKFYMLYAENRGTPTYRHMTIESAQAEAQRLAELLKVKIYILEACMSVRLTRFEIINLNTNSEKEELPF